MNMERTRIPARDLKTGDLIQQPYLLSPEQAREQGTAEASRTVVVGRTSPSSLAYFDAVHPVVRVTGLDVDGNRPVAWLAVPDQIVTVIR